MGARLKRALAAATLALLALGGAWQLALDAWIGEGGAGAGSAGAGWRRTLAGEVRARPWPWADTWPVAALEVGGERSIVLADAGGQSLAFGPSHVAGTPPPGAPGFSVLAGHRDTHFRVLRDLAAGTEITLTTADGRRHRFQVRESQVLPRPELSLPEAIPDGAWLILSTCWPFDALRPGGEERFVVLAGPPGSRALKSPSAGHGSATVPATITPSSRGGNS